MIVKYVKLHNIRSYLSEQINFPQGAVLLAGDIGAGKSTILLAIEFALFGVIRGSVDGAALLRHGKNAGYVELSFTLDGRDITINRSLKKSKSGVSQSAGFLVINGVKTDATPVELKAKMLELLGYPKSMLTKSKSLIYRYTVYTPQEEMKHILFEDAAERLDTVRKVFQLDRYKNVRDNAAIIARALREFAGVLEAKTEDLSAKKEQLTGLAQQEKDLGSKRSAILRTLEEVQGKIEQQRKNLEAHEMQAARLNELRSQYAAQRSMLTERESALKLSQTAKAAALADLKRYEAQLEQMNAQMAALTQHAAQLKSYKEVLEKQIAPSKTIAAELEQAQEQLLALSEQLSKASAEIESSKRLERNVLASDTCPVCLQPIATSHKQSFREKIVATFSAAEKIIHEKTAQKQSLGKKIVQLREARDEAVSKEREIARLTELLSPFSDTVPTAPPANPEQAIVALRSFSTQMQARSNVQSMIEQKRFQSEQFDAAIGAAQASIAAIMVSLEDTEKQVRSFPPVDELRKARAVLDELLARERTILIEKAGYEKDIEGIAKMSALLKDEIAKKEDDRKALRSVVEYRNWLTDYFIELMSIIERSIMAKVYAEFNLLFQSWFNILMEDEAISARLDDSFAPLVQINGYETPVESLSGGEKTSLALAYRLALNKVINDVITTIKTKDLLILDEPTDGFSSQQLEKVRDVLEQLNLPQVIIVSHEQKIESFVQNVIRIVKEQHVSHAL